MSARAEDFTAERSWIAPATLILGCAAIAARPVSYGALPATILVGVAGVLGMKTLNVARSTKIAWLFAFVFGSGAFLAGRALESPAGIRFTALGIASVTMAAVCEEAFFRGFLYGWVAERWGPIVATVLSAGFFAIIHQPTYGWAAMPIDLAAGLVLAWQRHVTGGWTASAGTHIIANLLQMG